jgi:hypothetical protein
MNETIRTNVNSIRSEDKDRQNKTYSFVLESTDKPVDWAYEVWDEMLDGLKHKDNHLRAISAQVLSNLAKSDLTNRLLRDFD